MRRSDKLLKVFFPILMKVSVELTVSGRDDDVLGFGWHFDQLIDFFGWICFREHAIAEYDGESGAAIDVFGGSVYFLARTHRIEDDPLVPASLNTVADPVAVRHFREEEALRFIAAEVTCQRFFLQCDLPLDLDLGELWQKSVKVRRAGELYLLVFYEHR